MTTPTPDPSLDLSAPAAPAPTATSTATPTATATPAPTLAPPTTSTDLVLVPPEPVAAVAPAQVQGMVPLDPAKAAELAARAQSYVDGVMSLDPRAPEFGQKVHDVSVMGDREVREASAVSNRMLERPVKALQAANGKEGEPQKVVADSLVELRQLVGDLDPGQVDKPRKKLLGVIPFGDRVRDYFDSYKSSQAHLNAIIQSLKNGQDELRKDNAAIELEKANLWATMQRLQEYAVLASSIDGALAAKADQLAATDPQRADQLRTDMLFTVRQKHQDLLTQLAVSAQGYLALDMVRRNNTELIKGVERATTTTVSALRTAVIVAQALANQKLVLDQISALNETTSGLIVATSEMLKQQTGQIHEQASSSTVSLDALKAAFANIYQTMDAIDSFKLQALDNMATTVTTLESEIDNSKRYLARAKERSDREALRGGDDLLGIDAPADTKDDGTK